MKWQIRSHSVKLQTGQDNQDEHHQKGKRCNTDKRQPQTTKQHNTTQTKQKPANKYKCLNTRKSERAKTNNENTNNQENPRTTQPTNNTRENQKRQTQHTQGSLEALVNIRQFMEVPAESAWAQEKKCRFLW